MATTMADTVLALGCTPAPWTEDQGSLEVYIEGADGSYVCSVYVDADADEASVANCSLIVAAPDLYRTLLDLVCCPAFTGELFQRDKESHAAWTRARDALAKARGENDV
jgi:hypothetical protein